MAEIHFFDEGGGSPLTHAEQVVRWLEKVSQHESTSIQAINYIFCTDEYLWEMNKKFLAHSHYTDIITFPYHEPGQPVLGDCYISTDRVGDNAAHYEVPFHNELQRVILHGLLHLIGYKDYSKKEKELMREKENHYLTMLTH